MTFSNLNHENKLNHLMLGSIIALMLVLGTALILAMHYQTAPERAWRIGINSWPGFDYLYLAEKKGFLKENGLNIHLVAINSMTDMRRAYERGTIDGYTGTIMDTVDSLQESKTPARIVLLTDFSTGGDLLLATPSITTAADLKGKRFGIELTSSLERYILNRFLEGSGVTPEDMDIRPSSQPVMVEMAADNTLDAILTYQPYATRILAHTPMHTLFDTSRIPQEILDILAVSETMDNSEKNLSRRLQFAWQSALDYATAHPDETNAFFAQRYGISMEEYKAFAGDLKIFNRDAMQRFASNGGLHQTIRHVAGVLNPARPLSPASISSTAAVWFQQEARP